MVRRGNAAIPVQLFMRLARRLAARAWTSRTHICESSSGTAGGGIVVVSFEGIKPGDRVRIEFAPPLAGSIEGEVFDVERSSIRLSTAIKELVFYLDLATLGSITVIEPPVQEGDVVIYENRAWTATGNGDAVSVGNGVSHTRWFQYLDVASLPSDSIWIIRGGTLNPKLGGE